MTIAVDLGGKTTKQTNKQTYKQTNKQTTNSGGQVLKSSHIGMYFRP